MNPKVFYITCTWTIEMTKLIFRSSSDREKTINNDIRPFWFVVVHNQEEAERIASHNPWNGDNAIFTEVYYLLDECVVCIRPARSAERFKPNKDVNKGFYFIEITNQDEAVKYSSNNIYSWDDAVKYASWFKGLSFSAAQRVWKVKKL